MVESKLFVSGPLVYFEPGNEKDLMKKMVASLESGIPIFAATDNRKNINTIFEKSIKTVQSDIH